MKNSVIHILLLLVTFVGTCAATSPIKLVSQDACRWGAKSEGEGENKHIVMDKGCPQYYTKKCKNVNVKFSTKKEDGEDILIVDWNAVTKTPDGKMKNKGQTKFVVGEYDGEEYLYVYEARVDCKGPKCKVAEDGMKAFYSIFSALGLASPNAADIWNKTYGVGIENAMSNANHDPTEGMELQLQTLMINGLGGNAAVSMINEIMDPIVFNQFIIELTRKIPCGE